MVIAFGVIELRREHPLLDVRLFANPTFATGAAAITVFFLAMFGFFYVVMQHMQLILGYSPIKTAFALTPLMGPVLLLSATSFWYLPRAGLRLVVFTGLTFIAVGFLLLSTITVDDGYAAVGWPLLVMSIGIGFLTAPTTSAIMNTAPDDKQGWPPPSTTPPVRSAPPWASPWPGHYWPRSTPNCWHPDSRPSCHRRPAMPRSAPRSGPEVSATLGPAVRASPNSAGRRSWNR